MNPDDIPELSGVHPSIETSRKFIAYLITWSFIIFIFITIIYSIIPGDDNNYQQGKELLSNISSMFGGLVGAIIGFYFGSSKT